MNGGRHFKWKLPNGMTYIDHFGPGSKSKGHIEANELATLRRLLKGTIASVYGKGNS